MAKKKRSRKNMVPREVPFWGTGFLAGEPYEPV